MSVVPIMGFKTFSKSMAVPRPNGTCHYCERTFQLNFDGRMRSHKRVDGTACEGSGLQFELPKRRAHSAGAGNANAK